MSNVIGFFPVRHPSSKSPWMVLDQVLFAFGRAPKSEFWLSHCSAAALIPKFDLMFACRRRPTLRGRLDLPVTHG